MKLLLVGLISFLCFNSSSIAQVQIGQDIDGEAANDYSGLAMALSGDGTTLVAGAAQNNANGLPSLQSAGHARIYVLDASSNWIQKGLDIDGFDQNGFFGNAVAISDDGNVVAVSAGFGDAPGLGGAGYTQIFSWSGTNWVQLGQTIFGSSAFDYLGSSVTLSDDGMTVAIGATGLTVNNGYVNVYGYNSGSSTWIQKGSTLIGESPGDQFGNAVSLSGDGNTLAVGARNNDGIGSDAGHVRIFQFGTSWSQVGVDIDGEAMDDHSGWSVSISDNGTRVIIGARENNANGGGVWFGHARVYDFVGGTWNQIGQDIDGVVGVDFFGHAVSVSGDGNTIAIGAIQNDGNGPSSGHVRIFQYDGIAWVQVGMDINGEAASDFSGSAVSLSDDGRIVAIGAPNNDGANGAESGHVRVYETGVSACQSNYIGTNMLTGIETGTIDYETDGGIESIQNISATATVDYDSKIEITLMPGFCTQMDPSTNTGAIFHAFIDGCMGLY